MSTTRRSSLRGTPSKTRQELGEANVEEESTPQQILTRRKRDAVAAVLEESSKSRSSTPAGKNRKRVSEDTPADSPAIVEKSTTLPASASSSSTRQRKQPSDNLPSTPAETGTPVRAARGGRNVNKLADLKQEAVVAAAESPVAVLTPRKSRRLSESLVATAPAAEICATPPRRGRKVSELAEAKKQPETAAVFASENSGGGTPRKSRRLSETVPVQAETVESCAPPTTGRSKKVSDAKEEETTGTPLAGTPRKSRRLSETQLPPTGTPVEATLPPRNRKVSELSAAAGEQLRAASPARKSRRLSGGGVEEDAGRPVLLTPTRTSRRRSICALDIPPVIAEEEQPAKVTDEQMEDEAVEEVAAANKMEAIAEVEEEDAGVAVVDTPPSAVEVKSETVVVPTQPEVDAPEVARLQVVQPEVAQPEVAQPEVAQPEVAQPEVGQPEVVTSEVAQPEVVQPEVAQPEVVQTVKATEGKKKVVELGEALEALQRLMLPHVPRQKPKSGKFWKADRSQFRAIRKDKGTRKTFEQRLKTKEDIQRAKDLAAMLIQAKVAAKQDHRRRIEENKKRREERERAAEVYQIVRNPNKIKKMKRKDLVKRDILGKVQA